MYEEAPLDFQLSSSAGNWRRLRSSFSSTYNRTPCRGDSWSVQLRYHRVYQTQNIINSTYRQLIASTADEFSFNCNRTANFDAARLVSPSTFLTICIC